MLYAWIDSFMYTFILSSGMFVAVCGFDRTIRILDFFSGDQVGQVPGHSELITAVKFSPDGQTLISIGGDGCILVWRLPNEIVSAIQDRLIELYSQARRKQIKVIQKLNNTINNRESVVHTNDSVSASDALQTHQQHEHIQTPPLVINSTQTAAPIKPTIALKNKPAIPVQKKPAAAAKPAATAASSNSKANGVASLTVVGTNVNNKKSNSGPRPATHGVPSYMAPKGAKLSTKPPTAPSSVFGFGNQKSAPKGVNKWQQKPPIAVFDSTKSYSLFGRKITPGQMTPSELNKFTLELTMEEMDVLNDQGFSVNSHLLLMKKEMMTMKKIIAMISITKVVDIKMRKKTLMRYWTALAKAMTTMTSTRTCDHR